MGSVPCSFWPIIAVLFLSLLCQNCNGYAYKYGAVPKYSTSRTRSMNQPKVFNVKKYGAVPNGYVDNSKAFLSAWDAACRFKGKSRIVIPRGVYLLKPVTFLGYCKGPISVVIKGTLRAPSDPNSFLQKDNWITFHRVDQLTVTGGGYLDGQGHAGWKLNDCSTNPQCVSLPSSLRFEFVTNSAIRRIKSVNSKKQHISLFACKNIDISYVRITAPDESPNTDGIHIGKSVNVKISKSVIGTGDDCIAMISGSENIHISEVLCGPGHGISIGSLGRGYWTDPVRGITVVNSTIRNTQNGLRIKTFSPSESSVAENIYFENIRMVNVLNPIFIDQDYCPSCGSRQLGTSTSRVAIRNATFKNIWGTSSSKVAMSLQCSKLIPCKNINLVNINLVYRGNLGGPAASVCYNVQGKAYGIQSPPGCL